MNLATHLATRHNAGRVDVFDERVSDEEGPRFGRRLAAEQVCVFRWVPYIVVMCSMDGGEAFEV